MSVLKYFKYTAALFFAASSLAAAADLSISEGDIRLEADYTSGGNGFEGAAGYHLYIRKKPDINSVLLTETTRDPTGMLANYAYRAAEWNPVNGDEIRLLNGKQLTSRESQFSIIDSTVEPDAQFGSAFHLFIPAELHYGYSDQRNGIVHIEKGTFINIRAFEKPYADYSGSFFDNPYMFDLSEKPLPPGELYNAKAVTAFENLARETGGRLIFSEGSDTIAGDVLRSVRLINPQNDADIVLAIDTTGSMKNNIDRLKTDLLPTLQAELAKFNSVRIGLLLYRDYGDDYNEKNLPIKTFPLSDNVEELVANLKTINIGGREGGDIPEAVYEALYVALDGFDWRDEAQKKIILIGDAEPHPVPRGGKQYTQQLVTLTSGIKEIPIDGIITPNKRAMGGDILTLTK